MQSISEKDFECFARTGVNTPPMAKMTDDGQTSSHPNGGHRIASIIFGQQDVKLSRSRLGGSLGRMSPTLRIIDDGPWKEGSSLAHLLGYSGLADRALALSSA